MIIVTSESSVGDDKPQLLLETEPNQPNQKRQQLTEPNNVDALSVKSSNIKIVTTKAAEKPEYRVCQQKHHESKRFKINLIFVRIIDGRTITTYYFFRICSPNLGKKWLSTRKHG